MHFFPIIGAQDGIQHCKYNIKKKGEVQDELDQDTIFFYIQDHGHPFHGTLHKQIENYLLLLHLAMVEHPFP